MWRGELPFRLLHLPGMKGHQFAGGDGDDLRRVMRGLAADGEVADLGRIERATLAAVAFENRQRRGIEDDDVRGVIAEQLADVKGAEPVGRMQPERLAVTIE